MADKYLMHEAVEQCTTWLEENLSATCCDAVLHVAQCLGEERLVRAAEECKERLQQSCVEAKPSLLTIRPPVPSLPLPDPHTAWDTPKSGGATWWDLLADIVALFDL